MQQIYCCGLIIAGGVDRLLSHFAEPGKNQYFIKPYKTVKKTPTLVLLPPFPAIINGPLRTYLTKIKNPITKRHVELLHQSVRDTKELEILSFLTAIHGDQYCRIINGYSEESSILKNSIINFMGETVNAFALRYFLKPIANQSKFITDRLKCRKNSFVKTTLQNPLFIYSIRLFTIRCLWRLEKFAINRATS